MVKRTDAQKVADIRAKQTELEKLRQPYEQMWADVFDYYPRRVGLDPRLMVKGQETGSKVYDTTHINSARLMADGFYGYLFAPSLKWFGLKMPNILQVPRTSQMRQWAGPLSDVPEVRQWLDNVEETLYAAFLRSNFYDSSPEWLWDGVTVGTATLHSDEDIGTGKIAFSTRHPGECYIAEDKFGNVDTLFRKVKIQLRNLAQRFGEEITKKATKAVQITPANSYQDYEVIHGIYPRTDRDDSKKDSKNMAWESLYVLNDTILGESGYRTFPDAVWRFYKNSFETYGRSPGTESLKAVMGLNGVSKDLLTAAQEHVFPPIVAPSELKGAIQRRPYGITYYKDEARPVAPLIPRQGEFPVGLDREQAMKAQIEQHFLVQFFLMLERAEQQMTAREVMERQGEKAAVMGAIIGRLTEMLDLIIDRVFDIERAAGRLPPLPQILMDLGGQPIEVDYLGPLATAQQRLFKTQGVVTGLQVIAPVIQLRPEVGDVVKWEELGKEVLTANGVPQKLINTPDEIAAIRQARAEQIQQQNMMTAAEAAADAIPKLGKGVDPNSPLAALMGGGA